MRARALTKAPAAQPSHDASRVSQARTTSSPRCRVKPYQGLNQSANRFGRCEAIDKDAVAVHHVVIDGCVARRVGDEVKNGVARLDRKGAGRIFAADRERKHEQTRVVVKAEARFEVGHVAARELDDPVLGT
jgi:hypothetical protein